LITLNNKYFSLVENETRYFIITGGRGSSKSFGVASYLCGLSFEPNHKILFTRQTMTSAHLSIIPEFQEKIDLMELNPYFEINKTEIKNITSKSEIIFKGIKTSSGDQTANLKSLQGVTTWILDEAEELTDESIFDKINLSIRQKGKQNRIILILNPSTKEHWIYKKFFEDRGVNDGFNGVKDDVTYIHTTYLDNVANLDASFIKEVERMQISNPNKYKHQILGGWLSKAEGVIFSNWTLDNFIDTGIGCFGQDFGFSIDPTTLIQISIDKAKKKIYAKEHIYKSGLTTTEIYNANSIYCTNKNLIVADSAEPRLIAELKQRGLNIKGVEKPKIKDRIAIMQDYELIIDSSSINLIKELNNYVWHDKKSETPIDDYNHCFIGSTLITTKKGLISIKDIEVGCEVLTSKGYKKVVKVFDNGIKKTYKYSMLLDTKVVSLCSTKEHKIKTTKGWKQIQDLQQGDILYQQKNLTIKPITYIKTKGILVRVVKGFTLRFISFIKAMFQKACTFTIKMGTLKTMKLTTLKLLKQKSIIKCTGKKDLKIILLLQSLFRLKGLKLLKYGTQAKKGKSGILNTQKSNGLIKKSQLKSVPFAKKNIQHQCQQEANTAITTVKLKHFEIEESCEERVYDLMVEDCHEYFANNILVHNCLDAFGYAVWELLGKSSKNKFDIR